MIKQKSAQSTETRVSMRGGPGEVIIRHILGKEELNPNCRLCAEITLKPGCGIGLHDHVNEEEIFIVRQGSGTVMDNKTEKTVAAGDAFLTKSGESHSITNTGSGDLVLTAIIVKY